MSSRIRMFRKAVWFPVLIFGTVIFVARGFAQLPNIPIGPVTIELEEIATGLNTPAEMAYPNDGSNRLFIVEQAGRVKLYKDGAVQATLFLDMTGRTLQAFDFGLLGLAFHPGFNNQNSPGYGKLYTYSSEATSSPSPAPAPDFPAPAGASSILHCVIAEWQVSLANPDLVDTTTRREVLRIGHSQGGHYGGEISFRASDGYLYIASGDGGGANDVGNGHTANVGNGQDKTNVLGDMLRIDPILPALTPTSPDPQSGNGKYRVPASNPFIGAIAGADEIFAWGFRNPYRFSFDPTNDRLVVGDVGQNAIEEVDIVEIGKNYGWNKKEGSFLFNSSNGSISPDPSPDPAYTDPVAEYDHGDGVSVIGGFVYRGTAITALIGKYVFGDYIRLATNTGRLFYTDLANGQIQELRLGVPNRKLGPRITGWGEDPSGELYVITNSGGTTGGKVQKLVPITASPVLVNLSTRGNVGTGQDVLIGGFIVTGSNPKTLLLRAIGPSLTTNGQPFPGRLPNPMLELHGGDGSLLYANDDWQDAPNAQQVRDTGLAPRDALESAILPVAPLQPGNYTAILRGVGNPNTGIGLVEVYDIDQTTPANAVNISTRGNVGLERDVMIGGFIIGGSQSHTVLVRALGPKLSEAGITNVLQDPVLQLRDGQGALVASNDDWMSPSSNQSQVQGTGLAPANNSEAAFVASSLAPGPYTAIVAGAGGTTGVALVEVYLLQ